jgi:hypothetical protein
MDDQDNYLPHDRLVVRKSERKPVRPPRYSPPIPIRIRRANKASVIVEKKIPGTPYENDGKIQFDFGNIAVQNPNFFVKPNNFFTEDQPGTSQKPMVDENQDERPPTRRENKSFLDRYWDGVGNMSNEISIMTVTPRNSEYLKQGDKGNAYVIAAIGTNNQQEQQGQNDIPQDNENGNDLIFDSQQESSNSGKRTNVFMPRDQMTFNHDPSTSNKGQEEVCMKWHLSSRTRSPYESIL